jgi:hypothetical protein
MRKKRRFPSSTTGIGDKQDINPIQENQADIDTGDY